MVEGGGNIFATSNMNYESLKKRTLAFLIGTSNIILSIVMIRCDNNKSNEFEEKIFKITIFFCNYIIKEIYFELIFSQNWK